MPIYHINNDGNVGACRAKKKPCPFGGWDNHYRTKEDARQSYEERQKLLAFIDTAKTKEHPLTSKALESSLSYDGPTPHWMNELSAKTELYFGTVPEIIDTIELNGKEHAVVWRKNSIDGRDFNVQKERGMNISALEYRDMKTGETSGYVNVAYIDDDSIKTSFGDDEFTVYRMYKEASSSFILDPEYIRDGEFSYRQSKIPYDENTNDETRLEAKKKLWAKSIHALGSFPESFKNKPNKKLYSLAGVEADHAPDSEEELDEQLNDLKSQMEIENDKLVRSRRVPVVDYSELRPEFRGQGLGSSLYVYSARKLAEQGLALGSSGVQSDEAQSLWGRMAGDKRLPVKVETKRFERGSESDHDEKLVLDFRKS